MGLKKRTELNLLLSKNSKYLKQVFFITMFSALLPVAPILYMRTVFGPVVNSGSTNFLLWVTAILVLLLSLATVLEYLRGRILFSFCTSITSKLEKRIFDSTFANTSKLNYQSGNSVLQALRRLRVFVLSPVFGSILDAPVSLIFLLIIFFIHPFMGMLAISGALIMLLIAVLTQNRIEPAYNKSMQALMTSKEKLAETFKNVEAAYTSGVMKNNIQSWKKDNKEYLVNQAVASTIQASSLSATKTVMLVQGSLLLGFGTFLSLTGIMDIRNVGNIIIAKFVGMLAVRPFIMAIMGWKNIIEAKRAYKEIENFLEEFKVPRNSMSLPKPKGELTVKNLVYVANDSMKTILDDISFNISAGSFLVVLGFSGAGKTTLAKLLVGFIPPTKGEVRLDGVEVSTWSKRDLADNIGYQPQGFDLFEGTIAENIARFNNPDEKEINLALQRADLLNLINKLKNGPNTRLDPDQLQFSRGELQKIALARAFYGTPPYIILDEPTSNLDTKSENRILQTIDELKKAGSTLIIMTHTKEIVKKAEYILGLTEGRQKMFGHSEELKRKLLPKTKTEIDKK